MSITNKLNRTVLTKTLRGIFVFAAIAVLSLTFLVSSAKAATGINRQINFQGKLVDNNGLTVADSTYSVVFSLYSVSSGGTAVWTEADSVTTVNGIFQVSLGANTAFPGNVDFNSSNIYLGIKVGSDAEMTPRVRFTAVPYAFNAEKLDGVVATQSATGFSLTGGSSTPKTLTLNDDITLGLTIQPTSANQLTILSNGANNLRIDTGSSGTLNLGNTNASALVFGNNNNPTYIFNGSGLTTLNGSVNIGTQSASPWKFYVSDYAPATAAATIENTARLGAASGCTGDQTCSIGLLVKMGQPEDSTSPDSGNRYLEFLKGDGVVVGRFEGNGTDGVSYTSSGGDYAEYFRKEDPNEVTQPGELMCFGPSGGVTGCAQSATGIVGVISNRALVTGNDHAGDPAYVIVGLVGQLPVKVSTVNGSIHAGDPLTFSLIPGVAMKATSAGEIIGRAINSYDGADNGTVTTYANRTWFDPATQPVMDKIVAVLADGVGQTVTTSEGALGTIQAGFLKVTELTTASLIVTTENITISGQNLRDYIVRLVAEAIQQQKISAATQTTSIAGLDLVTADLQNQQAKIDSLRSLLATGSATTTDVSKAVETLTQNDKVTLTGLNVEGLATISADLRVKNNSLIEGMLTVIDTLLTKDLIVNGLATFFEDVVFKSHVTFATHPTFSQETAGFAVIKKGSDHVVITFAKTYDQLPVINASISLDQLDAIDASDSAYQQREQTILTDNTSYIITKRSVKGFTILLQQAAADDISFSWTAFAVDRPITFQSIEITPTPTPDISATPIPIQSGNPTGEEVSNNAQTN